MKVSKQIIISIKCHSSNQPRPIVLKKRALSKLSIESKPKSIKLRCSLQNFQKKTNQTLPYNRQLLNLISLTSLLVKNSVLIVIMLVYIYDIDFIIHQTRNITIGDVTVSLAIQVLYILQTRLRNLKISIKKENDITFGYFVLPKYYDLCEQESSALMQNLGTPIQFEKIHIKNFPCGVMFQALASFIKISSKKHVIMKSFDTKVLYISRLSA